MDKQLKKANNPGQSDQLLSDDSDEEMTNESDRIPEIVQNQTIYKSVLYLYLLH